MVVHHVGYQESTASTVTLISPSYKCYHHVAAVILVKLPRCRPESCFISLTMMVDHERLADAYLADLAEPDEGTADNHANSAQSKNKTKFKMAKANARQSQNPQNTGGCATATTKNRKLCRGKTGNRRLRHFKYLKVIQLFFNYYGIWRCHTAGLEAPSCLECAKHRTVVHPSKHNAERVPHSNLPEVAPLAVSSAHSPTSTIFVRFHRKEDKRSTKRRDTGNWS